MNLLLRLAFSTDKPIRSPLGRIGRFGPFPRNISHLGHFNPPLLVLLYQANLG